MYRTLGNISRNPNVGLLFVKFDGKTARVRINGHATILDNEEALARHHAAKLVWYASNASCFPTAPARYTTWRAAGCQPICRIPVMSHPRRNGKAGITSRISCQQTTRIDIRDVESAAHRDGSSSP